MDSKTYKWLLTEPQSRQVLRIVADHGEVFFKELLEELSRLRDEADRPHAESDETRVDPGEIRQILQELKAADLVKEQNAPVRDFERYYLTANGLRAQRQIARLIQTEGITA